MSAWTSRRSPTGGCVAGLAGGCRRAQIELRHLTPTREYPYNAAHLGRKNSPDCSGSASNLTTLRPPSASINQCDRLFAQCCRILSLIDAGARARCAMRMKEAESFSVSDSMDTGAPRTSQCAELSRVLLGRKLELEPLLAWGVHEDSGKMPNFKRDINCNLDGEGTLVRPIDTFFCKSLEKLRELSRYLGKEIAVRFVGVELEVEAEKK
ncbi:hypothetical protein B0H11DRAFT_2323064 [Mycena galericulata]|nr:hypothetical protein B0H11DRAFT_2323064 [Mycena galericulata]